MENEGMPIKNMEGQSIAQKIEEDKREMAPGYGG